MKFSKAGVLLLALLIPVVCLSAITFPKLTGRVVDNAGVMSLAVESAIAEQLEAHERASTNQVVVVTVPNLQGYSIEEYGYNLGRTWGIGQKDKNNGVLLIVAKQERKVRIEVGYGLEGELTDAIASNIIHAVILPSFKRGDYNAGISLGTTAILETLGGKYVVKKTKRKKRKSFGWLDSMFWIVMILIFSRSLFGGRNRGGRYRSGYIGRSGGFSSGGGFSGGGGSFGGGGASGGW